MRPMTEAEYDRWRLATARAYADEQVQAGSWAGYAVVQQQLRRALT